ncbi:MAG: hypothetical protein V1799_17765 [bacterium]
MKKIEKVETIKNRRTFFLQLATALGGGMFGGNLLRSIGSFRRGTASEEKSITISTHPMAISRTKESSKSNVL